MKALGKPFNLPSGAAWRQTLRMTAAALLAYFATAAVGLHHGYWAVITCLVITQGSLGATISAGLTRVAGTAAGAALGGTGAVAALLYGGIPEWFILLLVIAPLALLGAARPIFKLAPLTGGLVLLLAGTGSLGFAASRVAEIALGTIIGVLVSMFVFPERATAIFLNHAASILEQLGALADVLLADNDAQAQHRLALKLRGSFAQMQNDMQEVAQERSAHLLRSDAFPERLLQHLQRLRTDVSMLGRIVASQPGKTEHTALAERIRPVFLDYAAVLRHPASAKEKLHLHDLNLSDASDTPAGFALLTLQTELSALRDALQEWIGPSSDINDRKE